MEYKLFHFYECNYLFLFFKCTNLTVPNNYHVYYIGFTYEYKFQFWTRVLLSMMRRLKRKYELSDCNL